MKSTVIVMKTELPKHVTSSSFQTAISSQIFLPVLLIALFVAGVQLPIVLGIAGLMVFYFLAKL